MTKRLLPSKRSKVKEDKENGIFHIGENGPHSSDEENPYIKTNLHTGVSEKLLINGEHKSPPPHLHGV